MIEHISTKDILNTYLKNTYPQYYDEIIEQLRNIYTLKHKTVLFTFDIPFSELELFEKYFEMCGFNTKLTVRNDNWTLKISV